MPARVKKDYGYECDCQCDKNQHHIPETVAKKSMPPEITVYESRLCIKKT